MNQTVKLSYGSETTLSDGTVVKYLRKRYNINGQRKTESLKRFIYVKANTSEKKKHNKDARLFAEEVIATEQRELDRSANGLIDRKKLNQSFLEVYQEYIDLNGTEWQKSEKTKWATCRKHLEDFYPDLLVRDVTVETSKKFVNHLSQVQKKNGKLLNKNSVVSYFKPYAQVAKDLWSQGILPKDPLHRVKLKAEPKEQAPSLTEEELKVAFNTPINENHTEIRNAFLFMCMTGFRVGDVRRFKWGMIKEELDGSRYIDIVMQKTGEPIKMWLSDDAYSLLPERQGDNMKVFPTIQNASSYQYGILKNWIIADCGIAKHITWHSGRHTFAYRYLRNHRDPVTLMNLLGHKNIETTMTYFNYKPEDSKHQLLDMPKL